MYVGRITLCFMAVGILAPLIGCESANQPQSPSSRSARPELEKPATGKIERPVTAIDKEHLMSGAGPIDEDAPQDFMETTSGLRYRILRKSDGKMPTASDSVTVHYRGWLDDGTEFDSSYKRGEHISFPLNGVIPGWTEGMQLVGTGGMVELWIPPRLGYGARGAGASVPPNATLHFIVELIEIK